MFFSVLFHVGMGLLSFMLFSFSWFQSQRQALTYATTVKVSLVDLPDQLVQKKINPSIPIENVRLKPQKMKIVPENTLKFLTRKKIVETQQKIALERLKTEKRASEKAEALEALKRGNKISMGAERAENTSSKLFLDAYRSEIKGRLSPRWELPVYLLKQYHLIGRITLFLDEEGRIIRKKIQSSGDRDFDYYMNRTIEQALPFGPVPKEIAKDLRYDGLTVLFKPKEIQ